MKICRWGHWWWDFIPKVSTVVFIRVQRDEVSWSLLYRYIERETDIESVRFQIYRQTFDTRILLLF